VFGVWCLVFRYDVKKGVAEASWRNSINHFVSPAYCTAAAAAAAATSFAVLLRYGKQASNETCATTCLLPKLSYRVTHVRRLVHCARLLQALPPPLFPRHSLYRLSLVGFETDSLGWTLGEHTPVGISPFRFSPELRYGLFLPLLFPKLPLPRALRSSQYHPSQFLSFSTEPTKLRTRVMHSGVFSAFRCTRVKHIFLHLRASSLPRSSPPPVSPPLFFPLRIFLASSPSLGPLSQLSFKK